MKGVRIVVAAVVVVAFVGVMSGCATLFNNKEPGINMTSQPRGVKVYVDGQYMGETPLKVRLSVKKEYIVEFRKEGYQSKSYVLDNHVGVVWVLLDIVTGFWPIVIDLVTGNWYELNESRVHMVLER